MKLMRVTIAALGLICVSVLPAFGLDPLCVAPESFIITSDTSMEVLGDATLTQDYDHQVCCDDVRIIIQDDCCDESVVFNTVSNGGAIRYIDENDAINGFTQLEKSFSANGLADPQEDNVEASKAVGYVAGDDPLSVYTANECAGLAVAQLTGDIAWNIVDPPGEGPAAVCVAAGQRRRDLALGSNWRVTAISASTDTLLNILGEKVSGIHNIDAEGVGTVGANVIAEYQENAWRVIYDGGCDVAGIPAPPAGFGGSGVMSFSEAAEASGAFNFGKDMAVSFDVDAVPGVITNILSLCPLNGTIPQLNLAP